MAMVCAYPVLDGTGAANPRGENGAALPLDAGAAANVDAANEADELADEGLGRNHAGTSGEAAIAVAVATHQGNLGGNLHRYS